MKKPKIIYEDNIGYKKLIDEGKKDIFGNKLYTAYLEFGQHVRYIYKKSWKEAGTINQKTKAIKTVCYCPVEQVI